MSSTKTAAWCTAGAFSADDRWTWFQGVSGDAELTATDRFIGLQLWERQGHESGYLTLKHETLARQIGVSNKTVRRAIQSLVSRGWIDRTATRGEDGCQCANAYRLTFPATASMPQQVVTGDPLKNAGRWSSMTIGEAGQVVTGGHAQAVVATVPVVGMIDDRLEEAPSGILRPLPLTPLPTMPSAVSARPSASPTLADAQLLAEAHAAIPSSGLSWPA